MTVIPLVASLLVVAVGSTGDVKSIGRIGGRTLLVFFLLLVGTAIVVMPLAPLVSWLLPQHTNAHQLPIGASEAAGEITVAGQAQTFSGWLTSLLPSNPIAAAASGAMMPLILFILLFALAIAHSPASARETLNQFFRALGDAMLLLVRWVILMAPIGVFALVLPLAVHAGAALAGAIGFYILAYSFACIAVTLLLYVIVSLVGRIPIRRFGRAALPAQLIAFSSSSSIAALPALVESAEVRLALPKRVTGFVLPLAVSTFKIATPVAWGAGAIFVGWFYGIPLQVGSLATDRLCCGVPRLCGAWNPAGRVYHAHAAFPRDRTPCRRHWHTHRGRRHSRYVRHRAQHHRKPRCGGTRRFVRWSGNYCKSELFSSSKVSRSPEGHNHALQSNGGLSLWPSSYCYAKVTSDSRGR